MRPLRDDQVTVRAKKKRKSWERADDGGSDSIAGLGKEGST